MATPSSSSSSSSCASASTLAFPSGRELVTETRARELVGTFADEPTPAFTHVTLRDKSYTLEAARVIADWFAQLRARGAFSALTSVDFADIIAGRPEDEALQVLATLCDALSDIKTLTRIDLSDNALGEKGVRACFGLLLGQEHLTHVFFCNNGISAAAAGVIADEVLLFRGQDTPTKLETFHFYNNMSGDGGAKALAKLLPLSPALRDLRFSATRAQREGSLAFAKALGSLRHLEKLDLSDNTFKAEGGAAIAAALRQQPNLVELNLRDASIEDDGVVAIADALSTTRGLVALDVSGNDLTATGARALAKALPKLAALQVLQVEENEVGSKGAKVLAKAIKKSVPALEKVIANVNEIGTSGAIALVEAVAEKAAFKILEIDGNMISGEGVAKIEAILRAKSKSEVLGSLEDNDDEGEDEDEEEDEEEDDDEEAEQEPPTTGTSPTASATSVDDLSALLSKTTISTPTTFEFENKQREVVDAARAQQLLQSAGVKVGDSSPLRFDAISLRGKSYTEEGAQVIADSFLARLDKSLKIVDLADVIAGRPEDEALRVLSIMCRPLRGHVLDEIDLSDNALGEKGVRACFDLLIPQPTLRRLLFCNNGISAAAAGVIAQEIILQNGQDVPSTLEEFHFYNNMSGHDGCLAVAGVLSKMPRLTAFRYASARAGIDASTELARSVNANLHHLTSLDLSDCSFEEEGVEQLAAAVGKQKQLEHLKLRDASLGVDGAVAVVKALVNSKIELVSLDLSGNELADEGFEAIAPLLKSQSSLKVLRLDENEVTSEGLAAFVAAVGDSLPALEELSLCGNEITAKGAIAVVEKLVPSKTHLLRLELDSNMISDKGVAHITAVLARLGKSDVLGSLDENDGDEESDEE